MDPEVFRILETKRFGQSLTTEQIRRVAKGAADGSWHDAELGAFLMAAAINGLDGEETRELTLTMRSSGEMWELSDEIPLLGDKHSTGGVGDKVSLILSPLLAACDRPVVMLTGRGLGHTGGTADKLEAVPGLDLGFDRELCLRAIRESGLAIGMATGDIAPSDKRLYALRDRTGTVSSVQLICASICSKKLATGAEAIVFDIKVGNGAFLTRMEDSKELGRLLVETCESVGVRARSVLTDMNQPLGRWAGHACEVRESLDCLAGEGPEDLMEVTYVLCEELSEICGGRLERAELEEAISSGRAREHFDRWALIQGADPAWLKKPTWDIASEEVVLEASRDGVLAEIDTRMLGELLAAAGGGRLEPGGVIDFGVSLRMERRLGDEVREGEELGRIYLRRRDAAIEKKMSECLKVRDTGTAPPLIHDLITA